MPRAAAANVRPGLRLLAELAVRDLWHDRMVSACIIASLVAVIAPLLLLFGLKYGVVTQLNAELLNDPRNLEVRMSGNHALPPEWFERLRAQPGVGFVIPLTRSLNTEADLIRDSAHFIANTELIPSAPGDPLLAALPAPGGDGVVLSASAASRLQAEVGDALRLHVMRKVDGSNQRGAMAVTVIGILPPSAFPRPAALVGLDLLVALEDFRDGFAAVQLGFAEGEPPPPRTRYARARIYAGSLDAVAPLAAWLEEQRIESSTRASEIAAVKAITRVLDVIFAVIAWTALIGCIAALAGALFANIDRKRRDVAFLRLLGFGSAAVGGWVVLQAVCLTGVAFAIGWLLYWLGSVVFNTALGANLADTGFVCRLEPAHLMLAFASALLLAIGVAAIGGLRAIHIQPSDSLRQS